MVSASQETCMTHTIYIILRSSASAVHVKSVQSVLQWLSWFNEYKNVHCLSEVLMSLFKYSTRWYVNIFKTIGFIKKLEEITGGYQKSAFSEMFNLNGQS